MTDREALWRSVEANLPDAAPKLVLADWLDEFGDGEDDRLTAEGLRWCGRNGKWPRLYERMPQFVWWNGSYELYATTKYSDEFGPHMLPQAVFSAKFSHSVACHLPDSAPTAFLFVGRSLAHAEVPA